MRKIFLLFFSSLNLLVLAGYQEANLTMFWNGAFNIVGPDTLLYDSVSASNSDIKLIKYQGKLDFGWLETNKGGFLIIDNDTLPVTVCASLGLRNFNNADTLFFQAIDNKLTRLARYSTATKDIDGYWQALSITGTMFDVCPTCSYTTTQAAEAASTSNDTIVYFSGDITESGTVVSNAGELKYIALGNCRIKGFGTGVFASVRVSNTKFEGLQIIGDERGKLLYATSGDSNTIFKNCYIKLFKCSYLARENVDNSFNFFNNHIICDSSDIVFDCRGGDTYINNCFIESDKSTCIKKYDDNSGNIFVENSHFDFHGQLYVNTAGLYTKKVQINNNTGTFITSIGESLISSASMDSLIVIKKNNLTVNSLFLNVSNSLGTVIIDSNNIYINSNRDIIGVANKNIYIKNNTLNIYDNNNRIFYVDNFLDSSGIQVKINNNKIIQHSGIGGGFFIGTEDNIKGGITLYITGNYAEYNPGSNFHGFQALIDSCVIDISYNEFHGCTGPYIFKGKGWDFSRAKITYNKAWDGRILLKGVDSSLVANNFVHVTDTNRTPCIYIMKNTDDYNYGGQRCQGNKIYNNIFIKDSVYEYKVVHLHNTDSITFEADNNIFWCLTNDTIAQMGGGIEVTFADWQKYGFDYNGYNQNPIIEENGVPQTSSVAIGKGKDLGEPYNIGLSPLSVWPDSIQLRNQIDSSWSIGAFVIYDKFSLNVNASPAKGGEVFVNPSDTIFVKGESVRVWAVASKGYKFTGWNIGEKEDTIDITMTSDLDLIAYFKKEDSEIENENDNIYVLTAIASPTIGGEVIVSPSDTSFEEGEKVKIIAVAYDGYKFTSWNTGVTKDTIDIKMTSDLDLIANFEIKDSDSLDIIGPDTIIDINNITKKLYEGLSFKIFPNPINNIFHLEIASKVEAYASVSIINMTGQRKELFSGNLEEGFNQFTFSAEDFKNGVYILQIITDYQTFKGNVIIIK